MIITTQARVQDFPIALFQLTDTDKFILEALYSFYWYLQAGTILESGHAHVFKLYARAQFFLDISINGG